MQELVSLVSAYAEREGVYETSFPGIRFYRMSKVIKFRKMVSLGPTLTIVAQGRKSVRFNEHNLAYDPGHYFVLTGEALFEGTVDEASPARPYLAVNIEIPSDLIAKTLLALGGEASRSRSSREASGEISRQDSRNGSRRDSRQDSRNGSRQDARNGSQNGSGEGSSTQEETVPAFVSTLDRPMRDAVLRFLRAIGDPLERRVVAPLALEEIVFRLLRCDAAAVIRGAVLRESDTANIQQAMRFIRANATRAISVAEVARHVAMSPSHFAHRFRAVARVTPMRYLKQTRMYEARSLLISGGVRISEAARRVGYESASHFTRDFKSYFGSAPAEFVRRFKNGSTSQD